MTTDVVAGVERDRPAGWQAHPAGVACLPRGEQMTSSGCGVSVVVFMRQWLLPMSVGDAPAGGTPPATVGPRPARELS